MGKLKDREAAAESNDATPSADINVVTPANAPLPIESPAIDAKPEAAKIEAARIERPSPEPMAGLLKIASGAPKSQDESRAENLASAPGASPLSQLRRHAPLAASIMFAALLGAVAGAAATGALHQPAPAPAAEQSPALRETVAKLDRELTALKSAIDGSSRSTSSQLGKLVERLDRTERAQAEPAARLAKIADGLDRLERRTASAPAEITGSITAVEKKDEGKPPLIEGWKLREYFGGRAVLEARNGTLFEVGPGSSLPGLGRVESVKRADGRVVVTTAKGVISHAFEAPPRRPPAYIPYRYY